MCVCMCVLCVCKCVCVYKPTEATMLPNQVISKQRSRIEKEKERGKQPALA